MESESENANRFQLGAQSIPTSTVSSRPWWQHNDVLPAAVAENASKSPSMNDINGGSGGKASQSQANAVLEKEADLSKEIEASVASGSAGVPPTIGECLVPHSQLELVGHSVACAPFTYSDPYYGGVVTAYGAQALAHSHLVGMHQSRMPLPLEMAEEPVYVNAKQYHGILRRRQSRAKAELAKKLIKVRKPYLHESRHQHAMRRARGCGGRFLNRKKLDDNGTDSTPEKGTSSVAPHHTQSRSSSGSPSKVGSSNNQTEVNGLYTNNSGCYQHHQGFPLSKFHSHTEEWGEEGDCWGQQRGSIAVNQAPNRVLSIQ